MYQDAKNHNSNLQFFSLIYFYTAKTHHKITNLYVWMQIFKINLKC